MSRTWMDGGLARNFYARCLDARSLRDQLVQMVRVNWGDPASPDLALYPDVVQRDERVNGSLASEVHVSILAPSHPTSDVLIYLHGGSWMAPMAGKHLAWATRLAHEANVTVAAVHYRLAPEHPFPAALHDCLTVFEHLRGVTHGRMFIGGDSAGGNLAAAVCHHCVDHGVPGPDKLLALCAMMDMSMEDYPSLFEYGVDNPAQDMSLLAFQRFCYVPRRADWQNPYVSPLFGNLSRLPPTLVIAAGYDALRDDAMAFAKGCKEAGVQISLTVYDQMPHAFFTHRELIPRESAAVAREICTFLAT